MPRNHNPDYSQIFTDDGTLELFAADLARMWVTNQTAPAEKTAFEEWVDIFAHSLRVAGLDIFKGYEIGGKNNVEM